MRSRRKRAVVVGAGIAGLTSAALLSAQGYDTTVLEKTGTYGGRASRAVWNGYTFDLGPTLLFMLDVYRKAFSQWGGDFDSAVPCVRLRPNYRLQFVDGTALTVSSFLSETMESLEAIHPGSSRGFLSYLAGAARSYETGRREFTDAPIRRLSDFLRPAKLGAAARAGLFRSLGRSARSAFTDSRIAAAFSFQSMYLGMSPFASPDLYRLLFFTEFCEGIYFPFGGIGALADALYRAAIANGAEFYFDCAVESAQVKDDAIRSVRAGDDDVPADVVLFNADVPYVYNDILRRTRHRSTRMKTTPSALLMYIGLREGYSDLQHHEFLMPRDLRSTCKDIFDKKVFPSDPAVYLAAPAVTDPTMAPPHGESLYVLAPAPNLNGAQAWNHPEELAERVLDIIEQRRLPGLRSRMEFCNIRTPSDWADEMNLWRGSAFGLSHELSQIGPFRPNNRDGKIKNAYFAGASTRPATGLPMVTLSALQTVDLIAKECPAYA